ncbi:HtaA domain-containing protein [Pseudolysinimonas sp.]
MSTAVSRSASRPLAILLSFVLAIAGLLVVPSPASAAPGDVTGGSASWGVDAAWRAMFSSPTMRSATGGASIASGDMPTWPVTTGSSWDAASGSGTVQLAGAVRLGYLTGAPIPGSTSGNYVYLNNPTISISGSTGTISAQSAGSSHELNPELPMAGLATRTIATLDLSGMTPTEVDGTLTWPAVPVAIAAGGTEILASYASADDLSATKRAVGSALDPITFSITREAPLTATTTSLTVSPVGGAVAGDDVTLTAEVAPSIDGTVQFRSGPDALGAPVTVVAGVASLTVDTLATATHSLAAVFTPADAGYAGSASAAVDFPVVATAPTRGAAWGLSTYLNSANFGRPNPSPANFVAPAGFDPATRVSTWGSPTVVSNADGTVTLNFSGATLNHAGTGGNWLRLADLSATLDAQGNGVVSAVVSYGTVPGTPPSIPYDASTAVTVRGPERVDLVTLSGNAVSPVAAPGGSTWSGLTGLWDADFLAFLAGGDGAAAWGYASTVTNTGAADRKPAPPHVHPPERADLRAVRDGRRVGSLHVPELGELRPPQPVGRELRRPDDVRRVNPRDDVHLGRHGRQPESHDHGLLPGFVAQPRWDGRQLAPPRRPPGDRRRVGRRRRLGSRLLRDRARHAPEHPVQRLHRGHRAWSGARRCRDADGQRRRADLGARRGDPRGSAGPVG